MAHADKLVWLARLGFAGRGFLYLVIAWLVIGSGKETDLTGALEYLREERALLIALLIVLASKRRRGRPPKNPRPEDQLPQIPIPVHLRDRAEVVSAA